MNGALLKRIVTRGQHMFYGKREAIYKPRDRDRDRDREICQIIRVYLVTGRHNTCGRDHT